jgi:exodeoxyribonuclease VII large subunit
LPSAFDWFIVGAMAHHPNTPASPHNQSVYTVSELALALKRLIERQFDSVRVRGEISGLRPAASGHLYFSLKDADAVLDAVCWRTAAQGLPIRVEDGLEVIATGRLTIYPGRSRYQLVVETIEAAGIGALLKLLEERRLRLAAEGLFDVARKRPIPFLPEVVGVVTSPTGAVIKDILHRLADRCPRRVIVWPVMVQGERAAEQVAAAIDGFNRCQPRGEPPRPDVLIVARGGGSLEDLWAFNEEVVVRAVAASRIPVISAIGHETDTTLIDFAADKRAPTPTAAAEMAVPVRSELSARLLENAARAAAAMARLFAERRLRLAAAARALPRPADIVASARQRLDETGDRLQRALAAAVTRRRADLNRLAARLVAPSALIARSRDRLAAEDRLLQREIRRALAQRQTRLAHLAERLEAVSYTRVLERGFALVHDAKGALVSSASALQSGDEISVAFADGAVPAVVGMAPLKPKRPHSRSPSRTADPDQGVLL